MSHYSENSVTAIIPDSNSINPIAYVHPAIPSYLSVKASRLLPPPCLPFSTPCPSPPLSPPSLYAAPSLPFSPSMLPPPPTHCLPSPSPPPHSPPRSRPLPSDQYLHKKIPAPQSRHATAIIEFLLSYSSR